MKFAAALPCYPVPENRLQPWAHHGNRKLAPRRSRPLQVSVLMAAAPLRTVIALIEPSACGTSFLSCWDRLTDMVSGCTTEGNDVAKLRCNARPQDPILAGASMHGARINVCTGVQRLRA